MNVFSRGIKNAFRSPLRSTSIILMLAISIGLILSMLVARSSIDSKINELKSSTGTAITISPAGMGMGGMSGGGNALTSAQLNKVKTVSHVSSVTASLSDQMSTSDTNLTSSLSLGNLGEREQRFENSSSDSSSSDSSSSATTSTSTQTPTARITVVGTTDVNSASSNGSSLTITKGTTIDSNSSDLVALIGKDLASKNSLNVGDTFTAYGSKVTIKGIFSTSNKFQDSEIIMPLATVQSLTSQSDKISSISVKADSSENVSSTVSAIKSALGDNKIDITSEQQQAEDSVASLESIASLALAGVIGASVAGAIIVLLAMIMVVRERRREIGILKAIGCSDTKVITQFIVEALSLTIVGAVVGMVLGVLVSGPITSSLTNSSSSTSSSQTAPGGAPGNSSSANGSSNEGSREMMRHGMQNVGRGFTQVTSSITPQAFIIAICITLFIAIVGSAVPAWLIARVRPSEVLRIDE